jgi:hypothetical protein
MSALCVQVAKAVGDILYAATVQDTRPCCLDRYASMHMSALRLQVAKAAEYILYAATVHGTHPCCLVRNT